MPAWNSVPRHQHFLRVTILASLAVICVARGTPARCAEGQPVELEARIALGDIRGRIDHMAVDLARHRLFVAALGNDSLAVVDLQARRLVRNLGGLSEPQGIGYDPTTDTVYVASGGDGSVRLFAGAELVPAGRIELGSDADNVRIDVKSRRIFVGHGAGALAIIDADTHRQVGSAALKAHPESFQLDASTGRIFVNVPGAHAVDVLDGSSGSSLAAWPTAGRSANFAMALDQRRGRILVAFRRPAEIGIFSSIDGRLTASIPICGDADDLFVDPKRDRVYVSCGDGFIDVLATDGESYRRTARIATAGGARTALFVPELDRLLLAVPARGATAAGIWMFRPSD